MIRVVKVGGSLFDLADLPERLRDWLSRQTPAHNILIAGGGALVDEVRRRHALRPIDEATAHWMCIDLMGETAKTLHRRLPEMPLVDDAKTLARRCAEAGATIFDSGDWLRRFESQAPGTRLACGWETTSDSIAARLAVSLGADELALLKSSLPAAGLTADPRHLAAAGYLDDFFPQLAAELPPTRVVDVRDNAFPEVQLAPFRHLRDG